MRDSEIGLSRNQIVYTQAHVIVPILVIVFTLACDKFCIPCSNYKNLSRESNTFPLSNKDTCIMTHLLDGGARKTLEEFGILVSYDLLLRLSLNSRC